MKFISGIIVITVLKAVLVSSYVYDPDYLVPPKCPPCNAKSCPQLTFCAGKEVKDHCGCCPRCSSDLFQPHVDPPTVTVDPSEDENTSENPCEMRQCPKFKVCMLNVQGLPICTCPSTFVCKTHGKSKKGQPEKVCGSNGLTYDTRCHLRIASCNSVRRIKRLHDGECTEKEKAEHYNVMGGQDDNGKPNEYDFGRGLDNTEAGNIDSFNKAKRRRVRQKKKKDKRKRRQRKKERRERHKTKTNKRQRRMKRRNEGYNLYSKRYGYLIGRHTKWSRSQIRKSRI